MHLVVSMLNRVFYRRFIKMWYFGKFHGKLNKCPTHFDQIQRKFLLSRLRTMVTTGLQKSYDKSELGANLVMYDVYSLAM
jgi:hypothetical protein